MHGSAKRGLALAAATTGLVLATAGIAAADAVASGRAEHSGGVVAGNAANLAASVPLNICGNQAAALAVRDTDARQTCRTEDSKAVARGRTEHSGGIIAGNAVDAAVSVPVNLCGNQVAALSGESSVGRSRCRISGGDAIATGSTSHSGGILAGNAVDAAVSVPVNACGNQLDLLAFADRADGSRCSIG